MRCLALRYGPLLGLLCACSIYDESLLGAAASGAASGVGHGGLGGVEGPSSGAGSLAAAGKPSSPSDGGSAGKSGGSSEPGGSSGAEGGAPGDLEEGGAAPVAGSAPTQAGATGSGGAGATGGSGPLASGADLVDDMEDGNAYISPKPPRYGFWYVAGDATAGAKLPKIEDLVGELEPARGSSSLAVHFTATGFKDWGANVGFSFTDSSNERGPYDAGNAQGVSFWVKGSVAGNAKLRVAFPTSGTDPSGKQCGGTDQGDCLDHFAAQIGVTSDWKQVTLLFSALHQAGWGAPVAAFEPKQMLGIEWTSTQDVDVWLDDLALLRP